MLANTIQIPNEAVPKDALVKVAGPFERLNDYELHALQGDGWRVVALVYEEEPRAVVVGEERRKTEYGGIETIVKYEAAPCKVIRYLLAKGREDELAALRVQLGSALSEKGRADKALDDYKKEAQARFAEADRHRVAADARAEDMRKRFEDTRTAKERLETDIAKIRRVLGQKAIDDALALEEKR